MRRLLATAALLAAVAASPADAAPANAAAAADAGAPVALGVFIHNSYAEPRLYDRYTRKIGHRPAIIGSYRSWARSAIDAIQLDEIWRRGAMPLMTWEPWGGGGRVYRLAAIAAGRYDRYVKRSARQAAAWGRPLFIRFAHEMNGNWYPWGRGANGNTPRLFVAAWRRVVRIFRAEGADNVRWVWCPNQNLSGRFPFRRYYPGDRWVDWVGLDGFNWLRSPHWQSFTEIFAGSYNALLQFTAKPVMIAETGSWEKGGSKAAWVSRTLERELPAFENVRALLWWSVADHRGDLRVDSSPAAVRALRAAAASPRYSATRADVLRTPENLPSRVEVSVGAEGSVATRVRRELKDNYVWVGTAVLVACFLALTLVLTRSRGGPAPPTRQDASL